MSETELSELCALFGVGPEVTAADLHKVYLQKSYALIRSGADEAERERFRMARDALLTHVEAARDPMQGRAVSPMAAPPVSELEPEPKPLESPYDPRSFDSLWVNLIAPPVVIACALLVSHSFFKFFLSGFHVWVHEFGHATVAWLTGRMALPLPIGWTNVGEERSWFVYFSIVFLLGVLFVAGARERKPWAMIFAVLLVVVQFYMTWRLPERTAEMWLAFSGIGGEFYLSAAMMALFFVELPEKFKWGTCRYFFLFIGASTFSETFFLWKKINRGLEGIPMGSMIHGEDDAGGDMNILQEDFSWTSREIIWTYNSLADACVIALMAIYIVFGLGLHRVPGILLRRWSPGKP